MVERLRTLSVPLVVVDPVGWSSAEAPSIGCTNWAGGFSATEHLIDLGHRQIAVIGGPAEMMCSQERIAGYEAAMSRAQIPVSRNMIRHGDFYVGGGRKAAAALLGLREPPTAIFAARMSRPAGSTTRLTRAACESRRTSAWSASTTSRCANGCPRG